MSESLTPSGPAIKPATERAVPAATERREHPRFKVEETTAVLGKGGILSSLGLGSRKSAVINLSQGGVLVLAVKRFPVGTRLHIRIEIPKHADIIEGEGLVRWCGQSAKNDAHYYVGIRLEGLDALVQKKIAQMREWFTSAEYRAKASARKDASSTQLKAPRV